MTLPLAMNGRLNDCLLLSYRTPADGVRRLVPRGLELVTRDGWAFWNIVACRVEAMRPAGVPRRLGVDYRHVGYRLHVRGRTASGETLGGLYFVRSDADSNLVGRFGNALTSFRFHAAGVELSRAARDGGDVLTLAVSGPDDEASNDALARVATAGGAGFAATGGSPFASAAEAEQFLRDPGLALAPDLDGRYFELAEAVRDEAKWKERPVRVIEAHWSFLNRLGQNELHLERAALVESIDCRWRLGRRVEIAPHEAPAPTAGRPSRPAARAAA
jgi:hypothetical protein